MQGGWFFDGALLHRPTIHCDQPRLTRNQSALRNRLEISDSIGARDWNQFRIWIGGDPGFDVRSVIAGFGAVLSRADARNLSQAEKGIQRNESWIEMLAGESDSGCAIGWHSFTDGSDFAVLHQHLSGRQGFTRNGMDGGAG